MMDLRSQETTALPSVDVVIPVRNGARFIGPCLDSVMAQTLQPQRVIVVNDGSTDGTADILNDYAARWDRIQVFHTEARGVSRARNIGIAASRAALVAFLDADDVWWPNKLERQIPLFSASPTEPGFVHCACIRLDESGKPVPQHRVYSPSKRGDIWQPMLNEFYWISGSASAIVARRDLLLQLGGFDETLFCGEDKDLWLKLARASCIDYAPDVLVGLRQHLGSTWGRQLSTNLELVMFQRLKIWSKWDHEFAGTPGERQIMHTFRTEATAVQLAQWLRRNPEFGLYRRLANSELRLARRLFRNRLDYMCNVCRLGMPRIKSILARHVVLRSPFLLRLWRAFGRFSTPQ